MFFNKIRPFPNRKLGSNSAKIRFLPEKFYAKGNGQSDLTSSKSASSSKAKKKTRLSKGKADSDIRVENTANEPTDAHVGGTQKPNRDPVVALESAQKCWSFKKACFDGFRNQAHLSGEVPGDSTVFDSSKATIMNINVIPTSEYGKMPDGQALKWRQLNQAKLLVCALELTKVLVEPYLGSRQELGVPGKVVKGRKLFLF